MTVTVQATVAIKKSRQDIFIYLKDLNYHYLWNPTLQNIQPLMVLKKGSTYKTSSFILGVKVRGNNQVTQYVNNQIIEIENNIGTIKYKVKYSLEDSDKETLLTCNTTIDNEHKGFAFTAPVLKLLIQKELHSDLSALQVAAEQGLNYHLSS
jgi:CRISPR/Cas system CMR-associated protein Cmr1 (group 7 of RAMP superfamily)